jgi:glutathione peroxidase
MQRRSLIAGLAALPLLPALPRPAAAQGSFRFDSIDGGQYDMAAWRGRPVLVVNTASLCGYTPQYDELQALHERYGPRGLIVLAVPSDDFRQELANNEDVAEFCEVNFGLTLPMTTITSVRGSGAHPFYRWLRDTYGFEPGWNFNKVLLDGQGRMVQSFGSNTRPTSRRILREIEALLGA